MLIIETVKTVICLIKLTENDWNKQYRRIRPLVSPLCFVLLPSSRNNCICIPLVANVPVSDQTLLPTEQVRKPCGFYETLNMFVVAQTAPCCFVCLLQIFLKLCDSALEISNGPYNVYLFTCCIQIILIASGLSCLTYQVIVKHKESPTTQPTYSITNMNTSSSYRSRASYLVSVKLCLLYRASNNPTSDPKSVSAQCLGCCYFVYLNMFTNKGCAGYFVHIYHSCISGPLSFQVCLKSNKYPDEIEDIFHLHLATSACKCLPVCIKFFMNSFV